MERNKPASPPTGDDQAYLLKLTGEVFSNDEVLRGLMLQFKSISGKARVAVLLGGGNYIRGARSGVRGALRVQTDRMGMLGTVLNGMKLEGMLRKEGIEPVHLTAAPVGWIQSYDPIRAEAFFRERRLLLLSGGTGLAYFSTDTSAVLRAVELGAGTVLKGTRVQGVYSKDPEKDPGAEFFPKLTYREALARNLAVMDQTAFSLACEHNLTIKVFNVFCSENLGQILAGEPVGTTVKRGVHR